MKANILRSSSPVTIGHDEFGNPIHAAAKRILALKHDNAIERRNEFITESSLQAAQRKNNLVKQGRGHHQTLAFAE